MVDYPWELKTELKLDLPFKSYDELNGAKPHLGQESDIFFANNSSTEAPIRFSWILEREGLEENTFSTMLNPNLKREFKSDLPFKS